MAWRTRYRRGSFRGAPFFLQRHDSLVGGRRVALHQYPLRDTPYPEDMGRVTKEVSFDAYAIGANYDFDRDALVAACNAPGPATLVHPYLGTMTVMCQACRVTETSGEGNIARLALTFVEAGMNNAPAVAVDHRASMLQSLTAVRNEIAQSFVNRFRI